LGILGREYRRIERQWHTGDDQQQNNNKEREREKEREKRKRKRKRKRKNNNNKEEEACQFAIDRAERACREHEATWRQT